MFEIREMIEIKSTYQNFIERLILARNKKKK